MTTQDHNKVIGIMHLIWGGFNALMMLFFVPFFFAISGIITSDPNAPPEVTTMFGFFGVFMLAFAVLFGLPSVIAGYAMLRRKRWARVAGVIASCLCALSLPFGTALCIYTLWFMFSPGEHFYSNDTDLTQSWRAPGLRDAHTFDWEAQRAADASRRDHVRDYVPPPQPPDWRS
jgi:hypothetical protein